MSYVLTLLFITPFINRKESRWFLSVYAFILLVAKELPVRYPIVGVDFFLFTAYAQLACMCASVFLLDKVSQKISGCLFFLYATYNACIAMWWGYVPLGLYNWIGSAVILSQILVITLKERGVIKNSLITASAAAASLLAVRYA